MTARVKKIIGISGICLLVVSLGLNVYIFVKYSKIKHKISEIVDNKIDNISNNVEEKNEEINNQHDEVVFNLENSFSKPENINYEVYQPAIASDGTKYVVNKINGKEYKFYLEDDIEKSHQQIVFYADKLNFLTDEYEKEALARNNMIIELQDELEKAKQELKRDLTDEEMSQLVNNIRTKFVRFGLDLWVNDNIPLTQWSNEGKINSWGYFSGGVGFNWLFMDKINLRLSVGAQQQIDNSINPTIGASIGFYF